MRLFFQRAAEQFFDPLGLGREQTAVVFAVIELGRHGYAVAIAGHGLDAGP